MKEIRQIKEEVKIEVEEEREPPTMGSEMEEEKFGIFEEALFILLSDEKSSCQFENLIE